MMDEVKGQRSQDNKRPAVERFNRQLDALLAGQAMEIDELSEADRRAFEWAARLAGSDFSRQSRRYYPLRQELLAGVPGPSSLRRHPELTVTRTLQLLMVAVLVGWAMTSLVYRPRGGDTPVATAYRVPATSLVVSTSTYGQTGQEKAIAPQPVPTPVAPVEVVSAALPGNSPPTTSYSVSPTQSLTRRAPGANP